MTAHPSVAEHAARLAERAGEVALCLDFDGTLSPIVDDPQAARPLHGIVELLEPLAERFAAVALISGRPAAYLAEHAAAPGVRYLGLYGLQEIHDGQVKVDPGKLVWELRPAVRGDKGDAVRRVAAESAAREVVMVGDDLGDLAAFAAVAGLTAEGGEGLRVAVRSAEAPPALLAEADLVVEGPPGVLDFLQRLAARPWGTRRQAGDREEEQPGKPRSRRWLWTCIWAAS